MAMSLVSTVTVGSGGAATIEFSNIPQTGKDLLIKLNGRSTTTAYFYDSFFVTMGTNLSNTTHNTQSVQLFQGSFTNPSVTDTNGIFVGYIATGNSASNTFGTSELYISGYTTSTGKSANGDAAHGDNDLLWLLNGNNTVTAAVTNLVLTLGLGGNFAQYTTASLYIIS